MANQSLTDLMNSLGPVEGFEPEPFLCAEVDTLTMYFENIPSYADRVDNFLTVFRSFESGELVGFSIKGVLRTMKQLGSMISVVTANTAKVHVKLIILTFIAEESVSRAPYDEVMRRAEQFDNAKVPVLAQSPLRDEALVQVGQ